MKGLLTTGLAACCLATALGTTGCIYRNLVDPCYPERYEYMARKEVNAGIAPQVQNGHVLDQTVWNYHFEPGTAKLNGAGTAHLAYLARRRPHPDTTVYVQTAQDVDYDTADPSATAAQRQELDGKRVEAVQAFLAAQTAGRGPLAFQVLVHDPSNPAVGGIPLGNAVQQMYGSYRGQLAGGGAAAGGTR
jgi:hypothetical protein